MHGIQGLLFYHSDGIKATPEQHSSQDLSFPVLSGIPAENIIKCRFKLRKFYV